jgi:cytochrome c
MFKFSGLTKSALGFGIPLVICVLGYLAAVGLYQTQGRYGDEHLLADKDAAEETVQEEVAEPDFAELFAAADLEKGAKVFAKCKACHKLESGANATGPYLVGIVGRDVAVADGFKYSDAMKELGGQWTPDLLNEFLTKPKDLVPGNKMTFSGLKKIDQRANLIAYLATISE